MKMTITEGLAETKTIIKRIDKKEQFITENIISVENAPDAYKDDGGIKVKIKEEMQSINDLEIRYVSIKSAISKVNHTTMLTVEGKEKSIAEWLIWKRDMSERIIKKNHVFRNTLTTHKQGYKQKPYFINDNEGGPVILKQIINIDEPKLYSEAEDLETLMGALDGKLSLKNATITIDI